MAAGLLEPGQAGSASALFNMFRNLGGSVGIALLATQLDLREKLHSLRLGETVSPWNPPTAQRLDTLPRHFASRGAETVTAAQQALGALAGALRRQARVMAYRDCFYLLGLLLPAMLLLVWLYQSARAGAAAAH